VDSVVETDRLRLRPWVPGDLAQLCRIFAEPEVWRFPFGRGFDDQETAAFLCRQLDQQEEGRPTVWAAELRQEHRLIGYAGLSVPEFLPEILPAVEVGWRLHPDCWGRGLATEAGGASLEHGFATFGLEEIVSIYQPDNAASGRVMEKLGMHFERATVHPRSGLALSVYRITRRQWGRRTDGRRAGPRHYGDEPCGPSSNA